MTAENSPPASVPAQFDFLPDGEPSLTIGGVPAHAEQGWSTGQLADVVRHGRGVIAAVNAGVLTITGLALDPDDGALPGFYVNDSGNGLSAHYVSAHLMTTAFERTGGFCVVTDVARTGQDAS